MCFQQVIYILLILIIFGITMTSILKYYGEMMVVPKVVNLQEIKLP